VRGPAVEDEASPAIMFQEEARIRFAVILDADSTKFLPAIGTRAISHWMTPSSPNWEYALNSASRSELAPRARSAWIEASANRACRASSRMASTLRRSDR
jgi:hypothetical protein